jgi:hypothetical protein
MAQVLEYLNQWEVLSSKKERKKYGRSVVVTKVVTGLALVCVFQEVEFETVDLKFKIQISWGNTQILPLITKGKIKFLAA